MKHISEIIEDILVEWAYRVHNGMPNIKNPLHIVQLRESMEELNLPNKVIYKVIYNIIKEADIVKNKDSGNVYPVQKHNKKTQTLIKKDASASDIEKVKKGGVEKDDKSTEVKVQQPTKEQSSVESKKAKRMTKMIGLISKEKSIQDEAGASSLSDEDAKKYSDYLETINTPEGHSAWVKNERKRRQSLVKKYGNVTDETVDKLDKDIAEKLCGPGKKTCKKYAKLKTALATKGGPPAKDTKGKYPDDHPKYPGQYKASVRYKNVLRAYLETGGICAITGEEIPIQDMQLDHITSLDNGGKDEPGNWMFTKANINQFKSSKENPAIQADLEEIQNMTDEEWEEKEAMDKLKEYKKKEQKAFWRLQFKKKAAHPTEEQLNKMSKDEVDAFVFAYNETVPEDQQISRYESQKKEVTLDDGSKVELSYTRGGQIRPLKDKPETWGLEVNPDTGKIQKNPKASKSYEDAQKAFDATRGSGGRKVGKAKLIKNIANAGLVSDSKITNETVTQALNKHREKLKTSAEQQRLDKAKEKIKDLESKGVKTGKKIEKNVKAKMKKWDEENPPPTVEKVKSGEDEAGNPIYKEVPLQTKNGKLTKKAKKTKTYLDWKKARDKKEYSNYRQEFYDTLGQEID